jgi:hypothetical protein
MLSLIGPRLYVFRHKKTEERAQCRTCGEIGDVKESSPGHQCLISLLFEEVTTW